MKRIILGLVLALGMVAVGAQAVVIQCDPAATGSAQYPNVACSAGGSLSVSSTPAVTGGTIAVSQGSITTGGTGQQIFAANATRKYLLIQNTSTGNMWVAFGVTATTTNGVLLLPNASIVQESNYVSNQTISIVGATTGQTFIGFQGN